MNTQTKYWLLLIIMAIIVTGVAWLPYAVIQQDLRLGADDPQIQMAEDIAAKLASGQQAQDIVPTEKVDIAKSLAPYIIIFDTTGKPIASSAVLNSQTPTIPSGVFDSVKQLGEDKITWQPQTGVRSAIVVTQFQGPHPGFVLVGRSLREVENRESGIQQIVFLGWLVLLFFTAVAGAILLRRTAKNVS